MEESTGTRVILVSSDNARFTIGRAAAELSSLLVDALSDDDEDEPREIEIPLSRVRGEILQHVVAYLNHHVQQPMRPIQIPIEGNSLASIIENEWYENYITSMERETVFEIVTAANYMGIKPLIDLACLFCSFELVGKSAEEIREIMNFPTMTAEEEAAAREEHAWVFEN